MAAPDDEVPSHFGLLHGKNLTPHRAIWTLVALSIVIGIVTVLFYLCGPSASAANDTAMDAVPIQSISRPNSDHSPARRLVDLAFGSHRAESAW